MDELNPRSLTRRQLSSFLGNNTDLIKAFEALFKVAAGTPDGINLLTVLVTSAQDSADSAQAGAAGAAAIAALSLAIARELNEAPTPQVLQLTEQVDDLTGQVATLQAQLEDLSRRCAAREQGLTP